MNWYEVKKFLRRTWKFIWEEDSWASWAVNIILAFILIKFIVYPVLGLALQTSYPIVAVVSGSMEHDGSFDQWWDSRAQCGMTPCTQETFYKGLNITRDEFLEFKHKNGFNTGDIMVLYGSKPENIKVGDVIVFRANRPDPIIHRVIGKKFEDGKYVFRTKGDHNSASIPFEEEISEDRLIGRTLLPIPYLGYLKIWFVKLLSTLRIV